MCQSIKELTNINLVLILKIWSLHKYLLFGNCQIGRETSENL